MPRFFLHVHNRTGFARDEEGAEFPDLAAARESALVGIRSILSEEVGQGTLDLNGRIDICGENGEVLAAVPFSAAVELRLEGVEA